MLSSIDYVNPDPKGTASNKIIKTKECFVKIKRLKLPQPPKLKKCTVRVKRMESSAVMKPKTPSKPPELRRSTRTKIQNTLYDMNTWSK